MKSLYPKVKGHFNLFNRILYAVIVFILVFSSDVFSQELVFRDPRLESGNAGLDGAVYRFSKVTTGVDALITIADRSGSDIVIQNLDVTSTGWDKAFQPQIGPINGIVSGITDWWVEFKIDFVETGTTISANVDEFYLTALDIDGDNLYINEYVELFDANSHTIEGNTLLDVKLLDKKGKEEDKINKVASRRFTGPVMNFIDIDTSGTKVMVTANYQKKHHISFRIGAYKTGTASSSAAFRYNSIWFKDFSYKAPVILPVTLSAFTINMENDKAKLKWVTEKEVNASHFVVQRSDNGRDYKDVALMFTSEDLSSHQKEYRYTDHLPAHSALLYYRLKMVDIDGRFSFSDIRLLKVDELNNLAIAVFPNPVTSELRVTIPSTWSGQQVSYQLLNGNGQIISSKAMASASQTEVMNVNSLHTGIYFIRASSGGQNRVQRFLKN